jgi:hypothetical protein
LILKASIRRKSMTHEDSGHYANKHPKDRKLDKKIAKAIMDKSTEGKIPCASAFKVVSEMNTTPAEAGFTIDSLEIKLTHCQLGTFGYTDKKPTEILEKVPDDEKNAVEERLEDGKLACKSAWEIADKLGKSKLHIGSVCETMKIKLCKCQLGAFK